MERNILSEVNRVREIMGLELVTEQDTPHEVGDKVDGQIFKGYITKPVAETFNELGMYTVNSDDPSKFLDRFVKGIIDTITKDPLMKKSLDAGTLQLAKATIRSGASNWYGTPLKPEVDNKYEGTPNADYYTNPEWFPEGYEALSGPETQNWIDNKDLALRRSTKFLAALKEALLANDPPIKIFPAIEETVTSTIVDTGGLTDEKCRKDTNCKEHHPNPGQFVDADLAFAYNEVEEVWEDFENCVGGMQITIAYMVPVNTYNKWLDRGKWSTKKKRWKKKMRKVIEQSQALQAEYNLPTSSKAHCCSNARFRLKVNGKKIGVVNLNNTGDFPNLCGARVSTITVTAEDAKSFAANSPDKLLTLSLKGLQSGTHSEVPLVKVVNGRGQTIFNGEPGLGGLNFDREHNIFEPFNPCVEIT
jgi:hypothetical protein